jgi:hypothetical protein
MRLKACELEIDRFCRGLRVPVAAALDEARGVRALRIAARPAFTWRLPYKSADTTPRTLVTSGMMRI